MSETTEKLLRELRERLDEEQAERQALLDELRSRRDEDDRPVLRGVRGVDFEAREQAVRDAEDKAGGRLGREARRDLLNRDQADER